MGGSVTSAFCASGATSTATTGVTATEEWAQSLEAQSIAFD